MTIISTLQDKTVEEAKQAVFDVLNSKALDVLTNMQNEQRYEKGEDIGKPGLNFDKIAAKAAKKYGSKEAGERVAGAILKKVVKEDISDSEIDTLIDTHINESVRKVGEYSAGRHKATIHKDSDLGEYKVKFLTDNKHLPDADYFTSEKDDAEGTAKHQVDQLHSKDTK